VPGDLPVDDLMTVVPHGPSVPSEVAWIMEHSINVPLGPEHEALYPHNPLPFQKCATTERYYALEILLAQIDSMADLPDDWDSYGAKAPSERSRREAKAMLSAVFDALGWRAEFGQVGVELIVGPCPDGVDLTWRKNLARGGGDLNVYCTDDGTHHWSKLDPDVPEAMRAAFRANETDFEPIRQWIDEHHAEGAVPDDIGAWTNEVLWPFLQAPVQPAPEYGDEG
jgi:hypothetical protein